MKQFLLVIFLAALASAATAQNTVTVERDTVFIASPEGVKVPVTSAEIRARVDEYGDRRGSLDALIALYEKIAAMKEQAFRLREEEGLLANLFKEVSEAEAKICKK